MRCILAILMIPGLAGQSFADGAVTAVASRPVHPVLIRNEHGPLLKIVVDTKDSEDVRVIMDMAEYGGLPQEQNGCSDPGIIVDQQTNEKGEVVRDVTVTGERKKQAAIAAARHRTGVANFKTDFGISLVVAAIA